MPTRRTYQNRDWHLECNTLEDSWDRLNYGPWWKDLCRMPLTQQIGRILLYVQDDYSEPYLTIVVYAYKRIKLDDIDGRHQFLTLQFYFWLRDVFIPFLQRVEGVIPDIFVQVNAFFKAAGLPVISQIIKKLRNHFSEVPLCIIHSFFFWNWRRNGRLHLMPQSSTADIVRRFTLAKLQRRSFVHVQSLPSIPEKDALMLISKLEHFKCVEGKLLRRRLLGLSVAQNLIKRLSGSHRDMLFLLMRVLGARSFA
jgi:hypothetical protein